MSNPPTDLGVLALLPDSWAEICPYLSAEQLWRLKMTGSKALWGVLCHGTVVKTIVLGRDGLVLNRWPVFLNDLSRIESLIIDDMRGSGGWLKDWQPRLDQIPTTLKSLTLLASAEKTIAFFLQKDGSQISLGAHLPLLESLSLNWDWIPKKFGLIPPRLTSLSVHTWTTYVPLPKTLVHLTAECMYCSPSKSRPLPPNLQTLRIQQTTRRFNAILPLLPTSMTSLHLGGNRVVPPFNLLPRSLTHLERFELNRSLLPNPERLLELPKSLVKLQVVALPSIAWEFLPLTLNTLMITSISSDDAIFDIEASKGREPNGNFRRVRTFPIHILPRSLTSLDLYFRRPTFLDWSDSGLAIPSKNPKLESSLFPPSLVYLRLLCTQLSVSVAKQLPHTLKLLQTLRLDASVSEYLPEGLTSLYTDDALLSPTMIKCLPRSLQCLHLGDVGHGVWFDPETGLQIGATEYRQKYYVEPDVGSYFGTPGLFSKRDAELWQDSVCLPPTLSVLEIFHTDIGDSFFDQRLPHLQTLKMHTTKLTDRIIPRLPTSLTVLSLANSSKITGKSFKDLPRNLTELTLNQSSDIYDSDIKDLPRSLRFLQLPNATCVTNLCGRDLPRLLWYLDLQENKKITKDIVATLPYRLLFPENEYMPVFQTKNLVSTMGGGTTQNPRDARFGFTSSRSRMLYHIDSWLLLPWHKRPEPILQALFRPIKELWRQR